MADGDEVTSCGRCIVGIRGESMLAIYECCKTWYNANATKVLKAVMSSVEECPTSINLVAERVDKSFSLPPHVCFILHVS